MRIFPCAIPSRRSKFRIKFYLCDKTQPHGYSLLVFYYSLRHVSTVEISHYQVRSGCTKRNIKGESFNDTYFVFLYFLKIRALLCKTIWHLPGIVMQDSGVLDFLCWHMRCYTTT